MWTSYTYAEVFSRGDIRMCQQLRIVPDTAESDFVIGSADSSLAVSLTGRSQKCFLLFF